MVSYKLQGDLLGAGCPAKVITVNTVGVPGKGLAKSWAIKYPSLVSTYKQLCREAKGGDVQVIFHKDTAFVMAFTKEHWRNPSQLEWIESICFKLTGVCASWPSVAIPMMGCSNGKLDEEDVWPLYQKYLHPMTTKFYVYEHKEN